MSESEKPDIVFTAKRFHIERRTLLRNDGTTEQRELVVHPGAVVLLPLLDDGRIVLIKNERFSVGRVLWELPAGTLEPSEALEVCAARELEEETGYRAQTITPLMSFLPTPGMSNERMHVFVARGLVKTQQSLDPIERIEPVPTSVDDVLRMIKTGEIEDGKTIATVLFWWSR